MGEPHQGKSGLRKIHRSRADEVREFYGTLGVTAPGVLFSSDKQLGQDPRRSQNAFVFQYTHLDSNQKPSVP
jgi:hypothetical protein